MSDWKFYKVDGNIFTPIDNLCPECHCPGIGSSRCKGHYAWCSYWFLSWLDW